ncbi:MAG: COX15/CtaA family protein [Rhodobacteraceae bacterium]|nr:COX15/CtaA family protein [Paracoccaceae bacterium]
MPEKRNIFEEVSGKEQTVDTVPAKKPARRGIAIWLMVLFGLVALMIVVGGMTRLTDSGLSITEWKPVTGAIPPLNLADWASEFDKYKATPEFELVNSTMTMAEFKGIYWWEWGHRFLGRFVGLVWAAGFFWFLLRRSIPVGWTGRMVLVGALGGLQGAVGWWMVASGLTGRMVDVASYRLAVHLGLAFVILGLIAWYVMELRRESADLLQARRRRETGLMTLSTVLVAVLFAQILLGALVAGIDAGRSFPTWPLMAGEFMPSESFGYTPLWSNFFENPALVQFNHRLLGYLAFIFGVFVWLKARKSPMEMVRGSFLVMMLMMLAQVVLGVITVLYLARVDIAITHQIGAVILFVLVLRARFLAAYPVEQKIKRG